MGEASSKTAVAVIRHDPPEWGLMNDILCVQIMFTA